jgi:lipopolysaccharide/colanic/teichoic acid biosynthesis glycosyltransferase
MEHLEYLIISEKTFQILKIGKSTYFWLIVMKEEIETLKKLEYDLYYMKNLSIAFDLLVIFKTVKTVLFKKGSR